MTQTCFSGGRFARIVARLAGGLLALSFCLGALSSHAQSQPQASSPAASVPIPKGTPAPPGYVIGADDALAIVFWFEKELSADVVVRPDGKISLPLINEIQAIGLTPEELRTAIATAAEKFVEDTTVSVVVKAINSRKVFITGKVGKPGPYAVGGPTTVLQLIAMAGGLQEYVDGKKILIMRTENGRQVTYRFNYNDVANGRNFKQNIDLKPGDTVVVP